MGAKGTSVPDPATTRRNRPAMSASALLLATNILVGITGYGDSPEFAEVVTNAECNLYVQWGRASNLTPGKSPIMDDAMFALAKSNGVHVMTIYGHQGGEGTKALREAWGPLYLGNNIGEFAGFLYQDEKSYFKSWPRCKDLQEAHDWLVGTMLAGPKKGQLARPEDEREPNVFSTSGSPLACYELEGGMDVICNEMYAVGCGDLSYAAAEARGAMRRHGRPCWTAWLAHEWQTCWYKLPYGVPQKQDSLEIGLKQIWIDGASMLVLESGSGGTQAQDYTPPDGNCPPDTKTERQGYDGDIPRAYRKTMRDFYHWTLEHPRAEGQPVVDAALLLGNLDGYVGMTWPTFAIFGQHHLATNNPNWKCAAPEYTWEAVMEACFPHPADALKPFVNAWIGGTPLGPIDVVNVDTNFTASQLSRYKVAAFGGWNTMTPGIAAALAEWVADGGWLVLAVPQLSSRIDREFENYAATDLVQAVPGVTVKGPVAVEARFEPESGGGPAATNAVAVRVAEADLAEGVAVEKTLGGRPYLVRAPHGKGEYVLLLDWDFPAKVRSTADSEPPPNPRLDLWIRTIGRLFLGRKQAIGMDGPDSKYIHWAAYPDGTIYLLNTDCVAPRTVTIDGEPATFAPKEMKVLKR